MIMKPIYLILLFIMPIPFLYWSIQHLVDKNLRNEWKKVKTLRDYYKENESDYVKFTTHQARSVIYGSMLWYFIAFLALFRSLQNQ